MLLLCLVLILVLMEEGLGELFLESLNTQTVALTPKHILTFWHIKSVPVLSALTIQR